MPRIKKSPITDTSLSSLSQTNGQKSRPNYTNLDQIWGKTGMIKYGTLDPVIYESQLREMTKSDLYSEAQKVGLQPVDNKERLIKSLIQEFKSYAAQFAAPPNVVDNNGKQLSPKVLKILAEGK